MKRLSAGLVSWSAALLSGCGQEGPLPPPPIDGNVPTQIETATFALG